MKYLIGIDLGTTNTCIAYVDKSNPALSVQPFFIESLSTLPSCCFIEDNGSYLVGALALKLGAKNPQQCVQSAKSWLCHAAAARRDPILPYEAPPHFPKISPVEASARYLKQIKDSWNKQIAKGDPDSELEEQEILLTVPASFDEISRMLTVEAAKKAGYKHLTLIEEPQAAFYSWLAAHESRWEKVVKPGDLILVCDVGGGTTDFSLIEVKERFEREAVGDHLLLGGDNMDAALVHLLQEKLQMDLDPLQWLQLRYEARKAKESLLDDHPKETYSVTIQGKGSKVVEGSVKIDLNRDEVRRLLLEGFFGQYSWDEACQLRSKGGIRSMGLPYEDEPSITKHLAHFLKQNHARPPSKVLFNGGAFKPKLFQESICSSLKRWFPDQDLQVLETASLDLAVARGAAYFGKAKHGLGIRIRGGSARSYYLETDSAQGKAAVCLIPRGSEDGYFYELPHAFSVLPNTPVIFKVYSSHVRVHDKAGDIIAIKEEEMQALPPIYTVLKLGKTQDKVPVLLQIKLSEVGTLEIGLKSKTTPHHWNLEFQLRAASGSENISNYLGQGRQEETFELGYFDPAKKLLQDVFESKTIKPVKLIDHLEAYFEKPRKDWSSSILRPLWDELIRYASSKKISSEHESRWWNLIGFCLRPGYGYPLDDHRIRELWKIILGDLTASKHPDILVQMWICFRRISGGLNKGQQLRLFHEIFPLLQPKKFDPNAYSEQVRALASLELIDISLKIKLGKMLLERMISHKALPADYWSLGRVGARHVVYGTIVNVIPAEEINAWLKKILAAKVSMQNHYAFMLTLLCRKTEHRELEVKPEIVSQVKEQLNKDYQALLEDQHEYNDSEKELLLGDRLPLGLTLEL